MKLCMALTALAFLPVPPVLAGETSEFSPEQLQLIQKMINEMKEELKDEVRREVMAELRDPANVEPVNSAPQADSDPIVSNLASTDEASLSEPSESLDLMSKLNSAEKMAVSTQYVRTAQEKTNIGIQDREGGRAEKGLQLTAGTEGGRASIKYGTSRSTTSDDGGSTFATRNLTLSAPLDKREGQPTVLANLDGLANDLELSFRYSRFLTKAPSQQTFQQLIAHCRELGILERCDSPTLIKVARAQGFDTESQQFKYLGYDSASWGYGFGLKVGYDEFTHFAPTDLMKRTDRETSWAASAFVGRLSGNRYYALSAEFQSDFEAARAATACRNGDGPVFECVTGALAPPSDKDKHLLAAEYRSFVDEFAFGVRFTHDLRNDESGIDLPIYLIPDDKGLLSGGIRLGWTTEADFSAGIFVGTAFKPGH